jgi:hypothetical protein
MSSTVKRPCLELVLPRASRRLGALPGQAIDVTRITRAVCAAVAAAALSACASQAPATTTALSGGASGGEVATSGAATQTAATGTGASACSVVRVFDDTGYGGQSLELNAGRFDVSHFEGTPVPNDSIRSVCVPPGWRVTLYADSGFAGAHVDLTSSVADLADFAGSASSAVVIAPGQ